MNKPQTARFIIASLRSMMARKRFIHQARGMEVHQDVNIKLERGVTTKALSNSASISQPAKRGHAIISPLNKDGAKNVATVNDMYISMTRSDDSSAPAGREDGCEKNYCTTGDLLESPVAKRAGVLNISSNAEEQENGTRFDKKQKRTGVEAKFSAQQDVNLIVVTDRDPVSAAKKISKRRFLEGALQDIKRPIVGPTSLDDGNRHDLSVFEGLSSNATLNHGKMVRPNQGILGMSPVSFALPREAPRRVDQVANPSIIKLPSTIRTYHPPRDDPAPTTTLLNSTIMVYQTADGKVSACESILDYTFDDKLLLVQALNNSGELIEFDGKFHTVQKNDALAVLGDAHMASTLCRWWWDIGGVRRKENWTLLRKDKLGNKALDVLGRRMAMDECIMLNSGTQNVSDKMMATAMEAVFGAVYLDGGQDNMEWIMKGMTMDQHPLLQDGGGS